MRHSLRLVEQMVMFRRSAVRLKNSVPFLSQGQVEHPWILWMVLQLLNHWRIAHSSAIQSSLFWFLAAQAVVVEDVDCLLPTKVSSSFSGLRIWEICALKGQ